MTTDAAAPESAPPAVPAVGPVAGSPAGPSAGPDVRPDARSARTTEALRVAILRLAAGQHVDRLSVAQIAAAANIHRVTFYDHARSPSALLARVMRDELDAVRAEYLASSYVRAHSLAEAVRHTSMAVATLVDSHSAIFEHLLAEHSRTTAHDLLAPHFEASVAALIADRSAAVPHTTDAQARLTQAAPDETAPDETELARAELARAELARTALAKYVAYGSVGAIEVWFAAGTVPAAGGATGAGAGAGRDPEAYYALIEPLLPRWLVA
ncbi:TetR/AcrR family transcriptional regulator [Cryobacterium frigoriphilum]|uniref:TetR/AcrR family transcriptional regulator n=1 Tax=Cryobacterium frigoriphilum TaxID=1259150 RepID=A0A4R9AA15_9MICO|nr:TetR/AcrR family transcriptional regulator [Cryobacterium frigoriphilum]TFD54592.1 TetR/AcrR family transcriptional regulator [Cryobacterium frigoriphilum]